MTELLPIQILDTDILLCDSRDIAKALGADHSNLLETIKTHKAAIEKDFGNLPFQTGTSQPNKNGAKHQVKFVSLTDEQAAFVITLFRNTPKVIEFKSLLVRSFSHARKQLQAISQSSQTQASIAPTDDLLLTDYMSSHIEEAKLVRSFDDLMKLSQNLVEFTIQYKDIEQEEREVRQKREKLRANLKSGSISSSNINIVESSAKALPIAMQASDTAKITECVKEYLERWKADNSKYARKPKGKNRVSLSLEGFMEQCKAKGLSCKDSELEDALESLGLKVERDCKRWTYYY